MNLERAFVISLLHHEERLTNFYKELTKVASLPEVEVWPAINGDTCPPPELWKAGGGAWGCYKSHLNILEYCLNNNISSYIVFEDDARIKPSFDLQYKNTTNNLPPDWEQLYFGGQLIHEYAHPPIKINDYVYRPYNVNRTHCFAVSCTGMKPMYKHISNLPFHHVEHIDHHLGRWHEDPTTKVFCPNQWVVGQHGFPSTISGKNEEVQYYHDPESLALTSKLYNDPICIIYQGPSWLLHKARKFLHPGNQVDAHGYDITLTLAGKMIDPLPEVKRWYDWVRSEVVRGMPSALPCLFHNVINETHLKAIGVRPIIISNISTVEDIEKLVREHL